MKKTIAYLGPEGSFSQQAATEQLESLPSDSGCLKAYPTIASILSAVDKGSAEWGVVPAENSIEGSVNITLDILANELNLYIQKEIVLEIKHYLLSYMTSLDKIHTVMSHPQALAQCRLFLEKYLPHAKIIETNSTSEAVSKLTTDRDGLAAIASWNSHILYRVPILVPDIGDFSQNQTRFWVVGKQPCLHDNTTKTSLVLSMEKDRPGSLYEVLGEFAKQNINLTKIESRPAKKELGNYIFFIDCEAGHDHPGLKDVLKNLCNKTTMLKVLGSYCVADR